MPTAISTICVYCASSTGRNERYTESARDLGVLIAARGIDLVYGGGGVGLMGVLADAVLGAGGRAHGVITRALVAKEVAHQGLTDLQVVETMHERKALMADRSDGFVMLPGGFGTLDEFFEAITWTQLGVHSKPCGILDVDGYFDPLRQMFNRATEDGLLRPEHRDLVIMETGPAALIDHMAAWEPTTLEKWVDRVER